MSQAQPIGGYVPSQALAIVGLAAFTLLATTFWSRYFVQGRHNYMLVLCISTSTMALGFGVRIALHYQPTSLGIYIITDLLTLLSPCGFLAMDYVLLPRIATAMNLESALFLRARLIVRLFVCSDIATFLGQAAGGGMTAIQSSSIANAGHFVALAALSIQCASFGLFTLIAIRFGLRMRQMTKFKPTAPPARPDMSSNMKVEANAEERNPPAGDDSTAGFSPERKVYLALLWTTGGILVRCIYRIVEFSEGYQGYIPTTEAFFYCLDTLPLFLAISIWTIMWPPKYISHSH